MQRRITNSAPRGLVSSLAAARPNSDAMQDIEDDTSTRKAPKVFSSPSANISISELSKKVISSYIEHHTPVSVILPTINKHQFHSLSQYDTKHKEGGSAGEEHPIAVMLAQSTGGPCGATWGPGEVAFKCKTCEKDPTCAICKDCFVNGNHEGHDYALITTSSGMCDCGDKESWDERGFCEKHKGRGDDDDVTAHLPWDVKKVTKEACCAYVHLLFVQVMQVYNLVHESEILIELQSKLNGISSDMGFLCDFLMKKIHDYPCYQRFFGEALAGCFNEERYDGQGILDMILQRFSELPGGVASALYDFLAVLIPDSECKKLLATLYCKHYKSIMTSFCEDSKFEADTEKHISSVSVQLFTVPNIAEELTFRHNLLENMMATLMEVSVKALRRDDIPTSSLAPTSSILRSSGFWHLMIDFSYILMHPRVCEYFFTEGDVFHNYITFLSFVHSCSEVKRIDSDSAEWWTTFSVEMKLVKRILDHFDTCIQYMFENRGIKDSMCILFEQMMPRMTAYLDIYFELQDSMKHTETDAYGIKHIEFNLVNGPVNFHFPIHKTIAQIVNAAAKANPEFSLADVFGKSPYNSEDFLLKMLENPMRCFVIGSHIRRHLWPRDNMQVLEQTLNYERSWPDYTVCNDLYLLQNLAAMVGGAPFLSAVVSRFANTEVLFDLEMPKDSPTLGLEEDALRFLLTVFTSRVFSSRDNTETAKMFLLHELFQGPRPFSEIVSTIPKKFRDVPVEEILQEVATQNADSNFVVKKEMWKYFNPYFINMSQREVELTLQNYNSLFKNEPPALVKPQAIVPHLEPLLTLLHTQELHSIFFAILFRTCAHLAESKTVPSDRSLMIVLHAMVFIVESMEEPVVQQLLASEVLIPGSPSTCNLLVNLHHAHPFVNKIGTEEKDQNSTILSLLIEVFKSPECKDHHIFLKKRLFPLLSVRDERAREELAQHLMQAEDVTMKPKGKKKRSTQAKRRAQKIMERFKMQQQQFDERAFLGDDVEEELEEDELCCFCHAPGANDNKLSALALVSKSSSVSLVHDLNMQDFYRGGFDENADVDLGDFPPKRVRDEQKNLVVNSVNAHNNINNSDGVQVNTCGHRCHSSCFESYYFSLLSGSRRFRGSRLLDLEKMEILCPICSSILNVMLPLLNEDAENIALRGHSAESCDLMHDVDGAHADLDHLWNILAQKNTITVQVSPNDQSNAFGFRDKVASLSDEDCLTDLVAYNIASREVAQRREFDTLERFSPKDRDLIRLLIKCVSAVKIREENADQIANLVVQSLKGIIPKSSYEEYDMSNEDTVLPLLSCDMFSSFMRLMTLRPALRTWSTVRQLVELLYCANIVQCLLVLTCRFGLKDFSNKNVEQLVVKLGVTPSMSFPFSPQVTFEEDTFKIMEEMLLLFLRRASLFVSVYFDNKEEIPLPLDTEFNALRDYLQLPSVENVIDMLLSRNHVLANQAEVWMTQLKSTLSLNKKDTFDLIPRFTKPTPFHFIALPKLYQNLFLHFMGKGCEVCGQKYSGPALSLTDGQFIGMKKSCRCHPSTPGGVMRHSLSKQGGQGLYLALKECVLMVISSGRYAFLKSMYKDKFGETDENLRRGKPLYLDRSVLSALETKFLLSQFEQDTVNMVSVDARSGRSVAL
eukprot:CAMPEP_0117439656 /NCGR_PEP_ID=MMETSP0759-20121206/2676_1 /TAXON_ID=63605 /ORGANISM="Percolomonas cosmopolitus, Strain WS" /LENGTH=1630 /DNA_ID=CAMNT_0005231375 /DNA_START=245 /DNA_END=5137 /DNA_ORIENTATION=+